ncbi:MAG: hypothetical protein WC314_18320 [Vulcanimicrobiota bacterium]
MSDRILELVRRANISRSWVGMMVARKEIENAERTMAQARSDTSFLDKLNFFTDSPEEAQVKDCKQRIKVRTAECEAYKKDVAAFLNSLESQVEHFSFAVKLESFLYRAGQLGDPKGCQALVKELTAWTLEQVSLSQEKLDSAPEQVFERVSGPLAGTMKALWMLRAVLSETSQVQEQHWGHPWGFLKFRPLILALIEDCYQAFKLDSSETPLPCDIFALLQPEEPAELEGSPCGQALKSAAEDLLERRFPKLKSIAERMAGTQLLLMANKSKISTLDRVVFWSDTEAEAMEKGLKAKLEDLKLQLDTEWEALVLENLTLRENNWGTLLLDWGSHISTLVGRMGASSPSGFFTKTSVVLNREEPVVEVERLRRRVLERYPQGHDLEQIRRQAAAIKIPDQAALGPTPANPSPPSLSSEELVAAVARELRLTGYFQNRADAKKLQEELNDADLVRGEIERGAGFLKVLGMMAGDLSFYRQKMRAQIEANSLYRSAEHNFLRALNRVHSPTAIGFVLSELGSALAAVTAYVAKRTYTDSDGDTQTEYYGALEGMQPVHENTELLDTLIFEQAEDLYFPLQSLEIYAGGPAGALLSAQPLKY